MKILFTSTLNTSFIKEDLDLLQRHFEVKHLTTRGFSGGMKILSSVRNADVTFTWFASTYAAIVVFAAKLSRKKAIIVIGGVDVADYPEIKYGIWRSWWKAMLVKYALHNAYRILAVDPFLRKEAIRLAKYDGGNIECVPTGYNPQVWYPSGEKEQLVLTVAKAEDESRLRVKGVELLLEAARQMPHVRFVLVGLANHLVEKQRTVATENMEVLPFVHREALLLFYQRAKVYCQPSYVEGFPNSVCEAMLCECVPVGTNVGGIPTAIHDIGFLVPYGDVQALTEALQQALQAPPDVGRRSRKRIADDFTLGRREESILRIVQGAKQ